MPDSHAVLDEIRDRVHRMVTPDGVHAAPDRYLTDAERRAGNWDCIANIAGDLTRLGAALRAVLDLHAPESEGWRGQSICPHCSYVDEDLIVQYPCDTVDALTEALGGTDA